MPVLGGAVARLRARGLFSPPSTPSGTIHQYTVQWDTRYDFANAVADGAGCDTRGRGSCEVFGAAIAGTPPYAFVIPRLTAGVVYYVRVAARNDIAAQAILPDGDNTKWARPAEGVPAERSPVAPRASAAAAARDMLQVLWTPPDRDGGRNITGYRGEVDTDSAFSPSWRTTPT